MLTTTKSSSLHRSNISGDQRDTFSPRKRLELNPGHVCGCGRALLLPLSHLLSSTPNSTSTYASSKPQNHDFRSATDFQHGHVRFTRASLQCRLRHPFTISASGDTLAPIPPRTRESSDCSTENEKDRLAARFAASKAAGLLICARCVLPSLLVSRNPARVRA